MKKTIFTCFILNFAFFILHFSASAQQAGDLDNTFSGDGIQTTAIGSGKSVAIQTDGKIVVAGKSYNGTNNDCDNIVTTPASPKPSFNNFLAGVKYAVMINATLTYDGDAYLALAKYLDAMGFLSVMGLDKNTVFSKNENETVLVSYSHVNESGDYYKLELSFQSIRPLYSWEFSTKKNMKDFFFLT